MNALTREEADALLDEAPERVPCLEGSVMEMRELMRACLAAGVPAMLGSDAHCEGGKCGPKAQLVIRPDDKEAVAQLLQNQWRQQVESLGVSLPTTPPNRGADLAAADESGELPCPACGTAAPLVEGACSDCGLQLE